MSKTPSKPLLFTIKPKEYGSKIVLSIQEKHDSSLRLTIQQAKGIDTIRQKTAITGSELFQRYLEKKPFPVYQLPVDRIKVMKGKFLYDRLTDSYVVNPTGWFASEKLDGIRAIWTGRQFYSKQGRLIIAPQWLIDQLPINLALDGELILGRGELHKVQSIVMDRHPNDREWKNIKYQIFDVPDAVELEFEQVQMILREVVSKIPFVGIISHQRIKNIDHLLEIQKKLVAEGAEGIMIRKPHTKYEIGEVDYLLKFKSQVDEVGNLVHLYDDEAIITDYKLNYEVLNSNGDPILRSLIVRWHDKKKFSLDPEFSVSHQMTKIDKRGNYKDDFPIGQKVRILYTQLFASQKPRYPRFGGVVV